MEGDQSGCGGAVNVLVMYWDLCVVYVWVSW